jgi:hypothetical protein
MKFDNRHAQATYDELVALIPHIMARLPMSGCVNPIERALLEFNMRQDAIKTATSVGCQWVAMTIALKQALDG